MVLDELLELLQSDDKLKELLGVTEEDPKIYAFGVDEIRDCIVYKLIPQTSDGVKEQSRFEVTIITQDMGLGLEVLEQVKTILLTIGDQTKTTNILEISLNGGGCLENIETNTIHHKAYFIIKSRRRAK